ncbi:MAG: hypothetical protein KC646_13410 [Candidatus Cloacimonetes bacterium]|nr:hypothetical protein [Candidatus Cloacimonadota bacterium]
MEVTSSMQSFSASLQIKSSQFNSSSQLESSIVQEQTKSIQESTYTLSSRDNSKLNKQQLEDFFKENDLKLLQKSLREYSDEVASKDAIALNSLKYLHSNISPSSEDQMRRLLKGMEETNDLEKIIFGEKTSTKKIDLKFEMSLKLESVTQQESPTNDNLSIDVKGKFDQVSNKVIRNRREADPLVFDLNGDGIETTGIENGVGFDINGDGKLDQTSFVSKDDFVLALDKNSNGIIDSGKELFGDANGHKDGIEELKEYDSNLDGVIDEKDDQFNNLKLFNKTHGPISLDQAGISEINLNRIDTTGYTNMGDRYSGALDFTLNGEKRQAKDIYFNFRNS